MTNRITAAIDTVAEVVNEKSAADIDRLFQKLDLSLEELSTFQQLKSLAVADGRLTLEEGQTLYRIYGDAEPRDPLGWPEGITLAARIVGLKTGEELLRAYGPVR